MRGIRNSFLCPRNYPDIFSSHLCGLRSKETSQRAVIIYSCNVLSDANIRVRLRRIARPPSLPQNT